MASITASLAYQREFLLRIISARWVSSSCCRLADVPVLVLAMRLFKSSKLRSQSISPMKAEDGYSDDSEDERSKKKKKKKAMIKIDDQDYFPEFTRKESKTHRYTFKECLIFSRWMRLSYVVLFCMLVGLLIPYLLDEFVMDRIDDSQLVEGTCHIKEGVRIDCAPELPLENITEEMCASRGCCYQLLNPLIGAPLCHHRIPSMHTLNVTAEQGQNPVSLGIAYNNSEGVWWEEAGKVLKPMLSLAQPAVGHVVMQLYDEDDPPADNAPPGNVTDLKVSLRSATVADDHRLRLVVQRNKGPQTVLFDCSYGSVILGSAISEISFLLPRSLLYGLGGMPTSFGGNTSFLHKSLFNLDATVYPGRQASVPFFMGVDAERHFFGVYVESESPPTLEVSPGLIDEDSTLQRPMVTFRSMGGFLRVHVYPGPTPADVVEQVSAHLGLPRLPPRWAMGYHVCRRSPDEKAFNTDFTNMTDVDIPFDSDCLDEGLFRSAFEPDSEEAYNSLVNIGRLVLAGKRFVLSHPAQVDVASTFYDSIPYVMTNESEPFTGLYHSSTVSLPDFTQDEAKSVWQQKMTELLAAMDFSGMNLVHDSPLVTPFEPCDVTDIAYVPRDLRDVFAEHTVCPLATHGAVTHLHEHNAYAASHMSAAAEASADLFVTSSHPTPGMSRLGGVQGALLEASWPNMRLALREVLDLGLSGLPLVTMTACGTAPANASLVADLDLLCLRWLQLSAFMPAMASFHGTEAQPRMPYSLLGSYRDWSANAIRRRYQLMPYLYTAMRHASLHGWPVVRPLFFEFPLDDVTFGISDQFMVGDALLVSPVLDAGVTQLAAYFPVGAWYELWSGLRLLSGADTGYGSIKLLEDIPYQIAAYVRAGSIVPTLESAESTIEESFAVSNYSMIVALGCNVDPRSTIDCAASGELFLPDAASLSFTATSSTVRGSGSVILQMVEGEWLGCDDDSVSVIDSVVVYGLEPMPATVTLPSGEDIPVGTEYSDPAFYEEDTMRLQITNIGWNFCDPGPTFLTWSF